MKRLILSAILALTFVPPAIAQEAAAPKPPTEITRQFNAQDVAVIGAICETAIWANRINIEQPCRALMQRLARTPADDAAPAPDKDKAPAD